MRTWGLLVALGAMMACAPPDPITVGGDGDVAQPEIRILFPEADEPLQLDEDGFLRTLVVVDVIDLEFAPPSGGDPVEGQGHYHLFVQETQYLEAPDKLSYELESDVFTAGSRGIINVDLRQDDHSLLSEAVDDCICTASIEFPVVAPGE